MGNKQILLPIARPYMAITDQARERKSPAVFILCRMRKIVVAADKAMTV